jgi:hypothetical protein
LDILLLALLIYIVFRWIRGTSAMSIFVAIISLYVIRVIVSAFNMRLMTNIMETVLDVGVIAVIVIFQPEIRKFLMRLGGRYMNSKQGKAILDRIFGKNRKSSNISGSVAVNDLAEACRRMSEDKTGALIVLAHEASLEEFISTGDRIDAAIHPNLFSRIFLDTINSMIWWNPNDTSIPCITIKHNFIMYFFRAYAVSLDWRNTFRILNNSSSMRCLTLSGLAISPISVKKLVRPRIFVISAGAMMTFYITCHVRQNFTTFHFDCL